MNDKIKVNLMDDPLTDSMRTPPPPSHTPEATPRDITEVLRAKTAEASWKYTAEDFQLFGMAADLIEVLRAEAKTAIDAAHTARAEARERQRLIEAHTRTLASTQAQSLKDQTLLDLQEELIQYQKRELDRITKTLTRTRQQRNGLADLLEMQTAVIGTVAEGTAEVIAKLCPGRTPAITPEKEDPRK